MNRMDDEIVAILGLMTLEELVHLIKELLQCHRIYRMDDELETILGLMTLEELVHLINEFDQSAAVSDLLNLKTLNAVSRVRIQELEHLIKKLEQSDAVSCLGNSESEPSESESTSCDCLVFHTLRSASYGGGAGGALELPKRANDRRGWMQLHAALGDDRDRMTPLKRQRRYDQVTSLVNVWSILQQAQVEVSMSLGAGDGCLEDLTENDT